MLRRLLNFFICQHLEVVRVRGVDGRWRFYCVRCRRSVLMLDRSGDRGYPPIARPLPPPPPPPTDPGRDPGVAIREFGRRRRSNVR